MRKNLIRFVGATLVLGMLFTGCAPKDSASSSATPEASATPAPSATPEASTAPETSATTADAAPTYQFMTVDKEKQEITMQTEVNGKYFTEPTRHGVVFKDGSNGEKSILRGLANEKEFYAAMMSLGFTPGNNLSLADMTKGVKVEGDKLDVFVTWDGLGKEIPFKDIVKTDVDRPMDIRFGGNIENAKTKNTGCMLCLDSCAVGITSNASFETGASSKIKFFGNKDVLPADGTKVTVIFRKAA